MPYPQRRYPKPSSCQNCSLESYDGGFTQIEGSGSRQILLVGEASGHNEKIDSLPFRPYAEAGSVLQMALRRAQIQRESLTLTNSLRCQPNAANWLKGNPFAYEALIHCRPNLDEVIRIRKPKVIVALGDIAFEQLTGISGKGMGIMAMRGFVHHSPQYNLPVVAALHPSYIRRNEMKELDVLTNDLILASRVAAGQVTLESLEDVRYEFNPSPARMEEWFQDALTNRLPIAYDIETAYSIKQIDDSDVALDDDAITEIQFSIRPKESIVFSWNSDIKEFSQRVLALPNDKWSQNGDLFDRPILRKHNVHISGNHYDVMVGWHCLQPDLPADLQWIASFYCPEMGPWKHWNISNRIAYCGRDVDAVQRIGIRLFKDLEKRGVARAFYGHIVKLRPILDRMCERGLLIDIKEQQRLRDELEKEMIGINKEIQALAPKELQRFDPTNGFANWPKEAQDHISHMKTPKNLWRDVYKEFQDSYLANPGSRTQIIVGEIEQKTGMIYRPFNGIYRWARPLEFNPSSSQQMIQYAKLKKYKVPLADRPNGTESEQANEQVILEWAEKHNDPLCKLVIAYKKNQKIIGTYIDGFAPSADGRVHSSVTFGPATGQLSSKRPSIMNFPKHGPMAKRIRKTVIAAPGHKLIEIDMKSFHARTLGFEAGCGDYMRLASLDIHSFVAAHFIKNQIQSEMAKKRHSPERLAQVEEMSRDIEGLEDWLSLPDDQLMIRLKNIKSKYKSLRDRKAKAAILGIGFSLGVNKLYKMNKDSFESVKEAKEIISLIQRLFPKIFRYQEDVKEKAHRQGYLLSKHGYLRRFFEVKRYDPKTGMWKSGESAEDAIAFQPANIAFGELRDRLIEMEEKGLLERYNFVNTIHDSVVFECPDDLIDECVRAISGILERPSTILIDHILGPFWCPCEASVGKDWSAMEEYKICPN